MIEHDIPGTAGASTECAGCQYSTWPTAAGSWCYLFYRKPETLPCAQHDRFAPQRKTMEALIAKHPAVLFGLVMEIMESLQDGQLD